MAIRLHLGPELQLNSAATHVFATPFQSLPPPADMHGKGMNPEAEAASSPAPRLARFSLWLPLGIMIFCGYLRRIGGVNALSHSLQVALGFGVIIAGLGGFACGIAALCHRRDGEANVVGRSVAGLALSSFLILMFLIGFVSGFLKAV